MTARHTMRFEIEVATTADPEVVKKAMTALGHDLSSNLVMFGRDNQHHVRITRVARGVTFERKPDHPTQRPEDPHLD